MTARTQTVGERETARDGTRVTESDPVVTMMMMMLRCRTGVLSGSDKSVNFIDATTSSGRLRMLQEIDRQNTP